MKETNYNDISLTRFAATMAYLTDTEKPNSADKQKVDEIISAVKEKTGKDKVEKLLIYNPDAIGQEFFNEYKDNIFLPLIERIDLQIPFLTAYPPKTPVCFATMYTGASPKVHGIQKYEKPVLKTDTLFDAWARAGKKVALVSKKEQSIPRIFAERDIDYYITNGDLESVNKGLELIKEDKHDIVVVYNQEYDDMLHRTHPRSRACRRAAVKYVASYIRLLGAVREYWCKYDTLMTFSPDHGAHRIMKILFGTHGKEIPSDMNILHFFTVLKGSKNE